MQQSNPTVAQFDAAWNNSTYFGTSPQNWVQSITQIAESIGKPVLFTETGAASFVGSNLNTGSGGSAGSVSDLQIQTNWWESFFNTWAVNEPSWLAGIFAWDMDPNLTSSANPGYSTDFAINGKPAEQVISSWFGGKEYLSFNQSSFTGSVANDQIYLYGNQISNALQAADGKPVTQLETFSTTISITLSGPIINGAVQTIHFYINGADEGAQSLANTPGTYVDSSGVTWTQQQTFNFTLSGAVSISQLKIAIDSAVSVGGPENETTYIDSIEINGVQSTNATYYPLVGSPQQQTLSNSSCSMYDGGYIIINASPWNNTLAGYAVGTAAQPIQVNGGGGTDTVYVLGNPADYNIVEVNASTVTLTENAGLDQNAVLTDISYIVFQDGAIFNVSTDTFVPTAASISATTDNNATNVNAGHLVTITLTTSLVETVTGTPTLQLNDGEVAGYTNGSGTNTLTFTYAVQPGDNTADLHVTGLNLPTGTSIVDNNGNSLLGPVTSDLGIQVDTTTVPPTSVQQEILGLYAALYGRATDSGGVSYWAGIVGQQSDGAGVTTANAGTTAVTLNDAAVLGQAFVNTQSTYFNSLYGSLNDSAFINALYVNIGGNAGDPGGIAYWANILAQSEAGGQSVQAARAGLVGQFVHDLVDYNLAAGAAGLTAAQLLAATQRQAAVDNKIAVSLDLSNASQQPGGSILVVQTVGDAAFQADSTVIQGVTYNPATVTAAILGINNAVAHQNLLLI
jgi:hypothetical protein